MAKEIKTFRDLQVALEDQLDKMPPRKVATTMASTAETLLKESQTLSGQPYEYGVDQRCGHRIVIWFRQKEPFCEEAKRFSGNLPITICAVSGEGAEAPKYSVRYEEYDKELYEDISSTSIADFARTNADFLVFQQCENWIKERSLYFDLVEVARNHGLKDLREVRRVLDDSNVPVIYLPVEGEFAPLKVEIPLDLALEVGSQTMGKCFDELHRTENPDSYESCPKKLYFDIYAMRYHCISKSRDIEDRFSSCKIKPLPDMKGETTYRVDPYPNVFYNMKKIMAHHSEGEVIVPQSKTEELFYRCLFTNELKSGRVVDREELNKRKGTCAWMALDHKTGNVNFGKCRNGRKVPAVPDATVLVKFSTF